MTGFTDAIVEENGSYAVIPCSESPDNLEFFPLAGLNSSLLAYCQGNLIRILALHFPQLEHDRSDFSCEILSSIRCDHSVRKICWSPNTSTQNHPVNLTFCVTTWDHNIILYCVDFKKDITMKKIGCHLDYINDCDFNPVRGIEVATVGDDNECCIWSLEEFVKPKKIKLSSGGVCVKYNSSAVGKFVVAERLGRIRMYNSTTLQPLVSFDANTSPLKHFDWSTIDSHHIGAVVDSQWMVWDTSRSSLPIMSGQLSSNTGETFRWSKTSGGVFAVKALPSNEIKITDIKQNKVIAAMQITSGSGVAWHASLPIIAIGGYNKIMLWAMDQ